jgi:DNA-directed RNA polymerase subunit RPC12/RpoP
MTLDEAIQHSKEVAKKERDKLLKDGDEYICSECGKEHEQLAGWLEELKEYKQLEEQGFLLKLPCKVGTTVYVIATIYECDNDYMDCIMEFPDVYQCERGFKCEYEHEKLVVRPKSFDFKMLDNFNKTVFLTKEEAEKELKEMECAE